MLSESYFKKAVEASADMIVIADFIGRIQYVNPAFTAATGWSSEEVVGKTPDFLKNEDTPSEVYQELLATLAEGNPWTGRLLQKRKENKTENLSSFPILGQTPKPAMQDSFWSQVTISPIQNQESGPMAYVALQHDISVEVEREERHKRDRDDATARAAIAQKLQEQRPLTDRLRESLELLLNLEGMEVQNKGGIFLTSPEQEHLDLYVTQGTFSQEFMEKERTIPKGYCLCGRAAVSGEMIISDDCFCDPRHDRVFEGMVAHGHYIVPLMHADTPLGILFLYTDPYPVQDSARIEQLQAIGELMGAAIANDQLNQRLEVEKERAETSNIAKSQFLANMSHEIRTPLNGVLGFADLLIEQDEMLSAEERLDFLSCIQTSGKHLLSVINDILDLSKIESDNVELEYMDYSPHQLIGEVVSLLRAKAQEKGLRFESEWTGPLPKTVKTDPTRLRQMLVNLVGNAIKFTDQGEVHLSSRIDQTYSRARLIVDVRDTGTGIPGDKQDAVFGAFQQADNSITRQFGGTGLGLSISKQLAVAMGGDITVQSVLGEGSTFTVTIDIGTLERTEMLKAPRADGVASSLQKNDDEQQDDVQVGLSPAMRVLLVEDGEINRKLIIALLSQAGVKKIDTAENGEIGVQRAKENQYDIILMDMQMPIMDGYTAAKTLRELGCKIPIIALTAHAMKGDLDKCVDAGCTDYLSKPIDEIKLFKKIMTLTCKSESDESMSQKANSEKKGTQQRREISSSEVVETTLPITNEVFLEIVQDFGDLLGRLIAELRSALNKEDRKRMKQIAHDLAGTAGGAGFGAFTNPSRHLESTAMTGKLAEITATVETLEYLAERISIPECTT